MALAPTIATHFLRPLARALRARGIAPEEVIGVAANEPRTPLELAVATWNAAVVRTGSQQVGLEAAQQREVGDYGALEYAARTSETPRAAFDRLARYHRLLNDRAKLDIVADGELTRLRYVRPGALVAMPAAYLEFVLASWVGSARELTASSATPRTTLLPHSAPPDCARHREIFGPDVRFDAGVAELQFETALMEAQLPLADAALGHVLDRHVEALLATLALRGTWTRAASLAIERRLAHGPPRLELVARDLALSPRALRGRLELEGASFSSLTDETRKRLAATMVADPSLSLGEIAFRLGFSESSAFHRAYRRWNGRTPRG
ncbi:MAG: hypothetical protein JWN04_1751 [Myxococcaceae bacterium]|nr:hypothetical protein [Myxococcaceae bacterium]